MKHVREEQDRSLAWWRDELLMLLFERGIDEALRQRQGLLAEGRLLLARVKSRRG